MMQKRQAIQIFKTSICGNAHILTKALKAGRCAAISYIQQPGEKRTNLETEN